MNIFETGLTSYFSASDLKKIRAQHIGIAGAGGLGSNIAVLLTRCGFIHFEIMDFDQVEAANLNRQYFLPDDIGILKTTALIKHLRSINSEICVNEHPFKWSGVQGSEPDPFLSCDILFEAFDAAETKVRFIDYYCEKISFIISGNGVAGTRGPEITVKHHDNIFIVGDAVTEAGTVAPPLAPRVMICAATMANIALDLVLNRS